MSDMGRTLVFIGGVVVVAGLLLMLAGRIGLPLGRLPGDVVYRGKNSTFYFPIVTSILLSIVLSVILYIVGKLGR